MPVISNVKSQGCTPTKQGILSRLKFLSYVKKHKNKPLPGTKAGAMFGNFCYPRQRGFNLQYAKRVATIRPKWFQPTTQENKDAIMKIAMSGGSKPMQRNHPLGGNLASYTYKCGGSYDHEFTVKLRKLRPDWFIPERWIMKRKKIISTAKQGHAKPERYSELGCFLYRNTQINIRNRELRKGNACRWWSDEFNLEIRALRPDWFETNWTRAEEMRKVVLKYAKRHVNKPKWSTPMGKFLSRCLHTNPFTPQNKRFKKALALIRPDWV